MNMRVNGGSESYKLLEQKNAGDSSSKFTDMFSGGGSSFSSKDFSQFSETSTPNYDAAKFFAELANSTSLSSESGIKGLADGKIFFERVIDPTSKKQAQTRNLKDDLSIKVKDPKEDTGVIIGTVPVDTTVIATAPEPTPVVVDGNGTVIDQSPPILLPPVLNPAFDAAEAKKAYDLIYPGGSYGGDEGLQKLIASKLGNGDWNGLNELAKALGFNGKLGAGNGSALDAMMNHPTIGPAIRELTSFTPENVLAALKKGLGVDVNTLIRVNVDFGDYTTNLTKGYDAISSDTTALSSMTNANGEVDITKLVPFINALFPNGSGGVKTDLDTNDLAKLATALGMNPVSGLNELIWNPKLGPALQALNQSKHPDYKINLNHLLNGKPASGDKPAVEGFITTLTKAGFADGNGLNVTGNEYKALLQGAYLYDTTKPPVVKDASGNVLELPIDLDYSLIRQAGRSFVSDIIKFVIGGAFANGTISYNSETGTITGNANAAQMALVAKSLGFANLDAMLKNPDMKAAFDAANENGGAAGYVNVNMDIFLKGKVTNGGVAGGAELREGGIIAAFKTAAGTDGFLSKVEMTAFINKTVTITPPIIVVPPIVETAATLAMKLFTNNGVVSSQKLYNLVKEAFQGQTGDTAGLTRLAIKLGFNTLNEMLYNPQIGPVIAKLNSSTVAGEYKVDLDELVDGREAPDRGVAVPGLFDTLRKVGSADGMAGIKAEEYEAFLGGAHIYDTTKPPVIDGVSLPGINTPTTRFDQFVKNFIVEHAKKYGADIKVGDDGKITGSMNMYQTALVMRALGFETFDAAMKHPGIKAAFDAANDNKGVPGYVNLDVSKFLNGATAATADAALPAPGLIALLKTAAGADGRLSEAEMTAFIKNTPVTTGDPGLVPITVPTVTTLPVGTTLTEANFKDTIRNLLVTSGQPSDVKVFNDGSITGTVTAAQMDKIAVSLGFINLEQMKTHPYLRDAIAAALSAGGGTNYDMSTLVKGTASATGFAQVFYNATASANGTPDGSLSADDKVRFMGLTGTGGPRPVPLPPELQGSIEYGVERGSVQNVMYSKGYVFAGTSTSGNPVYTNTGAPSRYFELVPTNGGINPAYGASTVRETTAPSPVANLSDQLKGLKFNQATELLAGKNFGSAVLIRPAVDPIGGGSAVYRFTDRGNPNHTVEVTVSVSGIAGMSNDVISAVEATATTTPPTPTSEVFTGDINGGIRAELVDKIAAKIYSALGSRNPDVDGSGNPDVDQLAAFMKKLSPRFTSLDEVLKHPDLKKLIIDSKLSGTPVKYNVNKIAHDLAHLLADAAQPGDPMTLTAAERADFFAKVASTTPTDNLPLVDIELPNDRNLTSALNEYMGRYGYTLTTNPDSYETHQGPVYVSSNGKAYTTEAISGGATVKFRLREIKLKEVQTPPIIAPVTITNIFPEAVSGGTTDELKATLTQMLLNGAKSLPSPATASANGDLRMTTAQLAAFMKKLAPNLFTDLDKVLKNPAMKDLITAATISGTSPVQYDVQKLVSGLSGALTTAATTDNPPVPATLSLAEKNAFFAQGSVTVTPPTPTTTPVPAPGLSAQERNLWNFGVTRIQAYNSRVPEAQRVAIPNNLTGTQLLAYCRVNRIPLGGFATGSILPRR